VRKLGVNFRNSFSQGYICENVFVKGLKNKKKSALGTGKKFWRIPDAKCTRPVHTHASA
jgi:hypothetical protein